MSDTSNARTPFVRFDGTIPTWGVVLVLLSAVAYFWNTDQDLIKRMTIVEVKVEDAKTKTDQIAAIAADVKVTKELLIRLEKQIVLPPVSPR